MSLKRVVALKRYVGPTTFEPVQKIWLEDPAPNVDMKVFEPLMSSLLEKSKKNLRRRIQ